jgi:hypothetical protein
VPHLYTLFPLPQHFTRAVQLQKAVLLRQSCNTILKKRRALSCHKFLAQKIRFMLLVVPQKVFNASGLDSVERVYGGPSVVSFFASASYATRRHKVSHGH